MTRITGVPGGSRGARLTERPTGIMAVPIDHA
jgi:hypothetical protein